MTNWISWLGLAFVSSRKTGPRIAPVRGIAYAGHGERQRPRKAILKAHNLHHTFGTGEARTAALRGVALELHRSELTLFMGPSGP